MTTRPTYFVVAKVMGKSYPCVYWDELPRAPIRNLEYVLRLDVLPNADRLVAASLKDLFAVYLVLKRRGKLPPRYEPPRKPPAEKPEILVGHRESQRGVIDRARHIPDTDVPE
jgi:hypothetical protein